MDSYVLMLGPQLVELCRKDWEVWPCWKMCAVFTLAQGEHCYFSAPLHSSERRSHPSVIREIYLSRRVPGSAMVEKGSNKRNRHRAYIGLLRGRIFQGEDFQGGNWLDFSS